MARSKKVRVGGTSVEISDVMDRIVEQVRTGAGAEVLEAMENYQAELLKTTMEFWPVGRERKPLAGEPQAGGKRKHSKNMFSQRTEITANGVEVTIGNDAAWAWAIRWSHQKQVWKGKKGRKPWAELVTKPGKKDARKIADMMAEKLVELANETAGEK